MLNERLKDHGSYFGALPVHNGKPSIILSFKSLKVLCILLNFFHIFAFQIN